MEIQVGGRYILKEKLGSGSFGDIYHAVTIGTREDVAIKLEQRASKCPQLQYENSIYKLLNGGEGISKIHFFSQEGDFNVMVMDSLGPTLEDLFKYCENKFTEKTVALIGIQCMKRLEFVHTKGFIHRDVKPENFLIGGPVNKKEALIHLIDFGLTKRYLDPKTGQHITHKPNKGVIGTLRFSSLNASMGFEQSRKDDLEALGNMMAYFLRGGILPWSGIKGLGFEKKSKKVSQIKESTSFETLFQGFSEEFLVFMQYVRNLQFDARPNYKQLEKLLKGLLKRKLNIFRNDWGEEEEDYDWIAKRNEIQKKEQEEKMKEAKKKLKEKQKHNIKQHHRTPDRVKLPQINQPLSKQSEPRSQSLGLQKQQTIRSMTESFNSQHSYQQKVKLLQTVRIAASKFEQAGLERQKRSQAHLRVEMLIANRRTNSDELDSVLEDGDTEANGRPQSPIQKKQSSELHNQIGGGGSLDLEKSKKKNSSHSMDKKRK